MDSVGKTDIFEIKTWVVFIFNREGDFNDIMGLKPEFPWVGGLVVDLPDRASTSLQFLVG